MKKSLAQFELFKATLTTTESHPDGLASSTTCMYELATNHPGFIWRDLEDNHELIQELWGEGFFYTLLVWEDVGALKDFLRKTHSIAFMKRGKQFVHPILKPRTVLWWIPQGHVPSVGEAHSQLELLYEQGPSRRAFELNSKEFLIMRS